MDYNMIDSLVNSVIRKIFEDKDISKMNDVEKSLEIYKYLTNHTMYDYKLLEQRQLKARVDLLQEVMNVFTIHTGICSSLSQAYKLLLEKVGVETKAVMYNDGNPILHQLLIIKNNYDNMWFFSDITRGIIYREEGLVNFAYGVDRCKNINQEMMGTLPEAIYDAVFKRNVKRYEDARGFNEFTLFDLPLNIVDS